MYLHFSYLEKFFGILISELNKKANCEQQMKTQGIKIKTQAKAKTRSQEKKEKEKKKKKLRMLVCGVWSNKVRIN